MNRRFIHNKLIKNYKLSSSCLLSDGAEKKGKNWNTSRPLMVLNFNSVSFEAQKNRENRARQLKYYEEHEK